MRKEGECQRKLAGAGAARPHAGRAPAARSRRPRGWRAFAGSPGAAANPQQHARTRPGLPPRAPWGRGALAGRGRPHSSWCLEGPLLPRRAGRAPRCPRNRAAVEQTCPPGLRPQGPAGLLLPWPRDRMDGQQALLRGAPQRSPGTGIFLGPKPTNKIPPCFERRQPPGPRRRRRSPRLIRFSVGPENK